MLSAKDLVGRGYSDGPAHMDYDVSLYVSQICMLLTSLPDWSGSFSIVGYSLGGVVATSFASYFPHRVDNLLLLCPAGLMKPDSLSGLTRLFCSGQVSTSFVQSLVSSGVQKTKFLVATDMVQWQLKHHDAFPYAFAVRTCLVEMPQLLCSPRFAFSPHWRQVIWPICQSSFSKCRTCLAIACRPLYVHSVGREGAVKLMLLHTQSGATRTSLVPSTVLAVRVLASPFCMVSSTNSSLAGISGLKVHIVEGAAHDMIQRPEFSDKVAHLMCTFLSSSM